MTFVNMEIDQGLSVPGWLNPNESISFYADLRHVEAELQSIGHKERGTVYLSAVDGLVFRHEEFGLYHGSSTISV